MKRRKQPTTGAPNASVHYRPIDLIPSKLAQKHLASICARPLLLTIFASLLVQAQAASISTASDLLFQTNRPTISNQQADSSSHFLINNQKQQRASQDEMQPPHMLASSDQITAGVHPAPALLDASDTPLDVSAYSAADISSGVDETAATTNEEPHQHQHHHSSLHEVPDNSNRDNILLSHHNSRLQAMHDMFERRQLGLPPGPASQTTRSIAASPQPLQSSQELSPISIGLDPVGNGGGGGFSMNPFAALGGPHGDINPIGPKSSMASADNLDGSLGPALPFGLNPLPHLLGFQNQPTFDGPQRGDQSAHSNHLAAAPVVDPDVGPSQKVWPKIFRFTDGRINLSDFEKQKKIRLSNKNQHQTDNHIESAPPIMFDGRPLKRKSFLILHGGIFSK